MGVIVANNFAAESGDNTVDLVNAGLGDCKAVIVMGTYRSSFNNGSNTQPAFCFGAAVPGAQGCVGWYIQTGSTAQATRTIATDKVCSLLQGVVETVTIEITEFITDGVRARVINSGSNRAYMVLFVYGDDVEASLDQPVLPASGAFSVNAGFEPDLVFAFAGALGLQGISGTARHGQGIAWNNGGAVVQYASGMVVGDSLATTECIELARNDSLVALPDAVIGQVREGYRAAITGFTATGFDGSVANTNEGGDYLHLFLSLKMDNRIWLGDSKMDGSGAQLDEERPRFQPYVFWDHNLQNLTSYNAVGGVSGIAQNWHIRVQGTNSYFPSINALTGATNPASRQTVPRNGRAYEPSVPGNTHTWFWSDTFIDKGWRREYTQTPAGTVDGIGYALAIARDSKIYKGGDRVNRMFVGSDSVVAAYKGSDRVYG